MKYNRHPFVAQVASLVAVSLASLVLTASPAPGGDRREHLKAACEIHLAAAATHAREAIGRGARPGRHSPGSGGR